jgi:hypothetical protein
MRVTTYIGTFTTISENDAAAIQQHGGHVHRVDGGKWRVEFRRPISPVTASKMMDDLLGREQLIQEIKGDIPEPDEKQLSLADAAAELRKIADDLLSPFFPPAIPVRANVGGPIIGNAVIGKDGLATITGTSERFDYLIRPTMAPAMSIHISEPEPVDPLDMIMVELQAADSASMAHEYRMHLEKIAVIVRAARETAS